MAKYSQETLHAMRELVCDMSEDEIADAVALRIRKYGNLAHDNLPVDETSKLYHSMVAERAILRQQSERKAKEQTILEAKEAEIDRYHSCW